MNFDFSTNEQALFESIRQLTQSRVPQEGDRSAEPPASRRGLERSDLGQLREGLLDLLDRLAWFGYLDLPDEDVGGLVTLMAAMEILAQHVPSLFLPIEMSARVFGRLIKTYGTEGQKEELLIPVTQGKMIGAVALSEGLVNIGNDPLQTKGRKQGDHVRLFGKKKYVVNAPLADWIAIVGQMEGKPTVFLVDKDADGLVIGERLSTMGYKGMVISSVDLEGCAVAMDRIIGPSTPPGGAVKGERLLQDLRLWEDQVIIAAALGLMGSSYEEARQYAQEHQSGGKPIIAYQEIGFRLTEMLTLWQTGQLLAYRAAWLAETGDPETVAVTHCAKVFCTEAAEQVASYALQVLAGQGYLSGNVAEEAYRNAKYGQIAGTSIQIARLMIADAILASVN